MRAALHCCSGTGLLLLPLLLLVGSASAVGDSLFIWKPSEISIETAGTSSSSVATFTIRVTANRTIAQPESDSDGTLAAHIVATSQEGTVSEGTSGCFSTYSEAESIAGIVGNTVLLAGRRLADLTGVRAVTYGRHANDYDRTIVLEIGSWNAGAVIDITLNTSACAELVTVAHWNDPSQWDAEHVPDELADVVLPPGAGVIKLDGDLQIASLSMEGGTLFMHRTDCQSGWLPGNYVFSGLKCYRHFEEHKTYDEAQSFCVDRYPVGNSLMRPVSDDQLMLSRRLCRGNSLGCWSGVRAQAGKGFNWVASLGESEQPRLLCGWARREPRNFTVDGHEEACVMIASFGTEMPTGDELHTWRSASCDEERPFICERAARTTRFTLTVSNGVYVAAGALRGAGVLKVNGSLVAAGDRVEFSDGVTVLLGPGASGEWRTKITALSSGARVELQEGSSLTMATWVQLFGWAGDNASTTPGPPPELVTHPGSRLVLEPGAGHTTHLNAYCSIAGSMHVSSGTVLNNVGGNFAHAVIELASDAELVIAGGTALLQTDGVVDLTLHSTSRMAGPDFTAAVPPGVYRLAVKSDVGEWTPTECIAFNATADELRSTIVEAGGGSWLSLLVRKVGMGLEQDEFAISYQIEHDHSMTGLPLAIECVGGQGACGCSNLTVEAEVLLGTPACTGDGWVRSASTDPLLCAKIPDVRLQPRVIHGRAKLTGGGQLVVQNGMHRLPATASVPIHVESGIAAIFAANVSATEITVAQNGTLFVAGAGAAGYDALTLTFAPPDVPFRSIPKYLTASTFSGSVHELQLLGNGKLLTPVGEAQLHVHSLTMMGGTIGGRVSMTVDSAFFDGTASKRLRYGANVTCLPDGVMIWTGGDLTMAEGSAIHIAGKMEANVQSRTLGLESTRPAEVLQDVQRMPYVIAPLPAALLNDYSSSSLEDPILGWYFNPLCAPYCETLPLLHVAATGTLLFHNGTRAVWNGELSIDGELFVVDQAEVTAQGVGAASGTAKVEVATGSVLDFRADMVFAEETVVTGQGIVAVSGPGSLVMPAAMNCTLVVNGGEARFTRVSHSVRDVVLQDGVVAVPSEVYETTVSIERDFNMSQGLCKLPRNLNRETDPDSPYVVHQLNVHHNMDWTGGRIFGSGVVNVAASARMFVGGESTTLGPDTRISNAGVATMGPHTQLYIESGSGIDYLGDGSIEAYTVDQVGNLFKAGAEGTDWAPHSWD